MSVRQEDIARHLGLSVTTVSLALRDSPEIAEGTRVLVKETASKLGYVHRSRSTTSFEVSRMDIASISFVMLYAPSNSFYGKILHSAERACNQHHLILQYSLLEEMNARFLKQCREADALLLVGSIDEQRIEQLRQLERPCVLVDNHLPHLDLDQVLTKNTFSLARTVNWLYERGHRQIAFLRGDESQPSLCERMQGYREAMHQLNLEPQEIACPGKYLQPAAEEAMEHWLATHANLSFTALIGCNDDAAIGALHALQNRGILVPQEVSIVGFDDVEMARAVWPQLTTNHVHRGHMGSVAVQLLIDRVKEPEMPGQTVTLGTTFVERASTRSLGA